LPVAGRCGAIAPMGDGIQAGDPVDNAGECRPRVRVMPLQVARPSEHSVRYSGCDLLHGCQAPGAPIGGDRGHPRADLVRLGRGFGCGAEVGGSTESVADTTNGADGILVTGFAQLLAESADMDIDGALLDMDVAAPDPIKQLRA